MTRVLIDINENKGNIKLIESDGWYEVRQKGSHRQYKHAIKRGLVTIPVHRLSNDLTAGLEKSILRQAQLDKK